MWTKEERAAVKRGEEGGREQTDRGECFRQGG